MKFKRLNKIKFMKKMASFPIDEAEFENFDYTQITENDLLNDDSWYKYFVYAKRNNRKDIFEHVKSLAKSIDARLVPEIRKYFEKICKKYDEEDINDYLNSEMGYISYGSGGYLSFMWGDDFLDHDYRDAKQTDGQGKTDAFE